MRILDRERYWAFFKAYLICFVSLVGLYIVIDAFTNLDEFTKIAEGLDLFRVMGRFYGIRTFAFYDRLCGVITMMAAIFTVTWMQRNNELLAMLAAGVSTQRVIRPVWIAAMVVSLVTIANQELVLPRFGEELQRSHDDVGIRTVGVSSHYDVNKIMLHGREADRKSRTIFPFNATMKLDGEMYEIDAKQARHIDVGDRSGPYRAGWVLHQARIYPPLSSGRAKKIGNVLIPLDDASLAKFPPPIDFVSRTGPGENRTELGELYVYEVDESLDILNLITHVKKVPSRRSYFLRSNLSFGSLTQKTDWHMFATTKDLFRAMAEAANDSNLSEIAVSLHSRIVRPASILVLLFLGLPQVLSGYGRNMFISLGLSLGTSALFYGFTFMCGFLGSNGLIGPEAAAWLPIIVFGTIAAARWGTIRT